MPTPPTEAEPSPSLPTRRRARPTRSSFQESDAGGGVDFEESYAASGEQRRAIEEATSRPRPPLARARRDLPRRRGHGRRGLEPERVRRDAHQLGGGLRGSPREPREHPDLGRPAPRRRRGDHAEPVHVRRRPVEHHGRVRRPARAGQVRRGSDRLPAGALPRARSRPGQGAREALQTFAGGKGDVMLAYENEAIFAQQAGEGSTTSSPSRRS